MNVTATPTKRRVLGSLDVNIQMTPRSSKVSGSPLKKANSREGTAGVSRHATPSPRKPGSKDMSPNKRPLEVEGGGVQPISKKLCSESTTVTEVSIPVNIQPVEKCATVQDADEDEPSTSQPTAGRRSISPDASSLFDTSVMNTSQDTTITEPDTDAPITTTANTTATAPVLTPSSVIDTLSSLPPPPPPPRAVPTREEFRQKAEILRLRLSLATYKVKTGQADVPLEKLQVRPVPGMTRHRTPLPSMSAHTIQRSTPAQQWYRSRAPHGSRDVAVAAAAAAAAAAEEDVPSHDKTAAKSSPPGKTVLPAPSVLSTPRKRRSEEEEEEARLTSSALRGGAAKGLLSLSQGSPL
ncbi:hypothetical protein VMCG_00641 [Cytospora schulzeri]|uniref:Uncharacterized protein n=1 Tax=Cytospora schulzeri TaxID=448051 RepID=A0A423XA46_9PEZI|nr:hypothetical protein VMCG_00641 [Valsa malicola]